MRTWIGIYNERNSFVFFFKKKYLVQQWHQVASSSNNVNRNGFRVSPGKIKWQFLCMTLNLLYV